MLPCKQWLSGLIIVLLSTWVAPRGGHLLPDGFVERAIQVYIDPDNITIQYTMGLNDGTLLKWLEKDAQCLDGFEESAKFEAVKSAVQEKLNQGLKVEFATLETSCSRPVEFELKRLSSHHVRFQAVATVAIPDGYQQARIDVEDSNFESFDGAIRTALKGRRGAMIDRCALPPILVRADRIELDKIDSARRSSLSRISADYRVDRD